MSRHYPNECWEKNPHKKPLRVKRREEEQKRRGERPYDDRKVNNAGSGFRHSIGALQASRIRPDHYENADTVGNLTEMVNKDAAHTASPYSFIAYIPMQRANAYKEPDAGDNRIAMTVIHQGEKYSGLLDTGATTTIINQDLANELDINYAVLPGADVQLLKRGMSTDNMITCNELRLTCNGRTVDQQILVMLIDNYDFVIGMDLFARFGFRIEGVILPKQSNNNDIWIQDEKPSIIPDEQPEEEMTEKFQEQKQVFTSKLLPTLKANEEIDPKSHCDLEIMRVELKVMPNCIIQERPRPFHAQTEKDEVDKTVQKWWDTGVIVRAPKGNPYNSSLTLAARKDLHGKIIKFRVCLDPRTLNKQLEETDNFPLPLISDILMKTAGHKYFSTIDLSQAYHRLPVDPKSQPYTAFTYGFQQYMFARVPFGLKPLTSIFQRGMSHLLSDMPYVCVYVDDIVIFSNTIEEHLEHVGFVIQRLTMAKLIILFYPISFPMILQSNNEFEFVNPIRLKKNRSEPNPNYVPLKTWSTS
jgi:hypothetical protein